MENEKLIILVDLFSSSSERIIISDEDLNVLWSNGKSIPQKLNMRDFYDLSKDDSSVFEFERNICGLSAKFPITSEKVIIYETEQVLCSVNVLPVFDSSDSRNVEGYVMTVYSFFSGIEKHIHSPFASVLKKFFRMLRNTASEVVFNTGLINQRLEDLEEYDLIDKNADINKILYSTLSSCINFEEAFIYAADDFNIMIANASEFITDLMHFTEHSARKIGVKFNYKIEEDIYLNVDYSRFLIAVMNLISNGIKYNISEKKQILVEFKKSGPYAELIVTDNGIGISNEKTYKIFEPFSNVNKTGTRESLGLPLVKKFADKFGGGITFKTDTSGTSFTLRIPYEKSIDINEVNSPNTDYFKGTYSPIDLYMLKADAKESID